MTDKPPRVVLASASPARLRTLASAGITAEVVISGVDESGALGDATTVAGELARRKAAAVAATRKDHVYVIACDSVLELDGQVLGKPESPADAAGRWRRMRGRAGVLHTGHCVIDTATNLEATGLASTTVHFADISDDEIAAYVATGEPLNVAGAFTVDGLGGAFVERIEGDHHNVVGLSLPLLRNLFQQLGVKWTALWHDPPEA